MDKPKVRISALIKPVSVVQLHSADCGGGAEAVLRLQHRALQDLGHESQVLVATKSGSEEHVEAIAYRRGLPGTRRLARWIERRTGLQSLYEPSFRHVARQFPDQVDVVHVHSLHSNSGWSDLVGLARLARRFPLVMTLHDLWALTGHCAHGMECERWKIGCGQCPDLQRYPAVERDATAWNWKRKRNLFANHPISLIAPSGWVMSQVAESPYLKGCRVDVVPNPIDIAVFTPGDRMAARKKLGVPDGWQAVLVAANLIHNQFKGGVEMGRLLEELRGRKTCGLIVGHGSEDLAKSLSIKTIPLGYLSAGEAMAEAYRAADVFVMPSKVETFGLAAAEAVACGTAVASFRAGGLEETVQRVGGIAVDDGDLGSLLNATLQLLNHDRKRHERVALGRKAVLENYAPEVVGGQCVEVYRRAIELFRCEARN